MAVTVDLPGWPAETSAVTLRPEIVIACHSLCVLKCVDDDDWFMGTINDDGSIPCWAVYPDLEQALRGL